MKDQKLRASGLDADHDHTWSLLPWFVNGTLNEAEHDRAAAHLAVCLTCRREMAALDGLQRAMASRNLHPQCEAALGRLHARLDVPARLPAFPWATAAVLVFVIGITGLVAVDTGSFGNASTRGAGFKTLGTPTLAGNGVATARIVFDQQISELQLRELLLAADAELIDGPTRRGAYTIALRNTDRDAGFQHVIERLRRSRHVTFVEPIAAIGPRREE